ncbi:MAG: twin-arginine translocase TatA/TatE family subunit [Myxococcota bacterium]
MFGIGPTELMFFLVIVLLAVGPEKLPTFMRTVGKGVRQVRNASREFKEAIGLDELMREGDPFRSPPVREPKERPVPVEAPEVDVTEEVDVDIIEEDDVDTAAEADAPPKTTVPPPMPSPPVPPPSDAAQALRGTSDAPSSHDADETAEPDAPTGTDPR